MASKILSKLSELQAKREERPTLEPQTQQGVNDAWIHELIANERKNIFKIMFVVCLVVFVVLGASYRSYEFNRQELVTLKQDYVDLKQEHQVTINILDAMQTQIEEVDNSRERQLATGNQQVASLAKEISKLEEKLEKAQVSQASFDALEEQQQNRQRVLMETIIGLKNQISSFEQILKGSRKGDRSWVR